MRSTLPRVVVPRILEAPGWEGVPPITPFLLADGSGPARQQTVARICHDGLALHARFDCDDRDIRGTYSRRDDPIHEEEAVELFLAPGEEDPTHYFEFEVSPRGVLLDARVHNPSSRREDMEVDVKWSCPGIEWRAGADAAARHWWAEVVIPWSSVAPAGPLPAIWRANLYRIERPRGGPSEFSGWSATLTDPPDFHKPAFFGYLEVRF